MRKAIKIIAAIIILMIFNGAVLVNSVRATDEGIITIYTKGEFKRIIKYNGIVVKTANAVYQKNGTEYPAYCLNKDLHGVGEYIATYDLSNQGKITDANLWKVIINGYPYKTIEQLGVANEGEAYTATKQAIYCYIYDRGTEGYSAIGEAGSRVISAINIILENAKNTTENFENQNLEIVQSEKWEENNDYISKQYKLKSNINISKFIVSLENQPDGSIITNLEGQEKSEFNSNEKFKILIPISSLEKAGEFKIKIQTEMETKPIFFGKAPSEELQDYALTAFSYENIDLELNQDYPRNETKIIIEKQDRETGATLTGAKVEVWNEDKNLIKIVKTDSNGQIILNSIIPGTYYVREIEAPEGYKMDEKLIKIPIKLNEKQIIEIKNTKIIIEEEILQEEEELPRIEELPVIEIPKLPVTGM